VRWLFGWLVVVVVAVVEEEEMMLDGLTVGRFVVW